MLTSLNLVLDELRHTDENFADLSEFTAQDVRFLLPKFETVRAIGERICRRDFAPWRGWRYFNAIPMSAGGLVQRNNLYLDRELLSVESITLDENAIDSSDYKLLPEGDTHRTMIWRSSGWVSTDNPVQAIGVLGVWAYRPRPSEAWLDSLDTLQAVLNTSATTLTVGDADGADAAFYEPRFSPGQLLRIDAEYMVLGKVTNNTLTVRRGVNGTVPASHAQGAPITIWQPDPDVQQAMTRWTCFLYQHRGQYDRSTVDGGSETVWPSEMPEDTRANLQRLMRIQRVRKI